MKTIVKTLDVETVTNIERIAYELEARKGVITEMLSLNMDIGTEAFAKYQSELVRFKAMFETAKKEIEKQYVAPVSGWRNWELDYSARTLTITIPDEAAGDLCG